MNKKDLLKGILNITDIMLNALITDDYEIFETELENRDLLINQLIFIDQSSNSQCEESENKILRDQILDLDKKLEIEFKNFSQRAHENYNSVKNELMVLKRRQNVSDNYKGDVISASISRFDYKR